MEISWKSLGDLISQYWYAAKMPRPPRIGNCWQSWRQGLVQFAKNKLAPGGANVLYCINRSAIFHQPISHRLRTKYYQDRRLSSVNGGASFHSQIPVCGRVTTSHTLQLPVSHKDIQIDGNHFLVNAILICAITPAIYIDAFRHSLVIVPFPTISPPTKYTVSKFDMSVWPHGIINMNMALVRSISPACLSGQTFESFSSKWHCSLGAKDKGDKYTILVNNRNMHED